MSSEYFINENLVSYYLKNRKRKIYLGFCVLIFLLILYSSITFHKYGIDALFIIYEIISIAILIRILLFFAKQVKGINKTIVYIEFSDDKAKFRTLPFSLFGGLMSKGPIEKECNRGELKFYRSDIKFTFNKGDKTAQVYTLSQEKEMYLLVDSFFDEFEKLKHEVENFLQ